MVSPQVAALIAFWKFMASVPELPVVLTFRIQLEPVVNVGHVVVPWIGRVRLTVLWGNVGGAGTCARTFPKATKTKIMSTTFFFTSDVSVFSYVGLAS